MSHLSVSRAKDVKCHDVYVSSDFFQFFAFRASICASWLCWRCHSLPCHGRSSTWLVNSDLQNVCFMPKCFLHDTGICGHMEATGRTISEMIGLVQCFKWSIVSPQSLLFTCLLIFLLCCLRQTAEIFFPLPVTSKVWRVAFRQVVRIGESAKAKGIEYDTCMAALFDLLCHSFSWNLGVWISVGRWQMPKRRNSFRKLQLKRSGEFDKCFPPLLQLPLCCQGNPIWEVAQTYQHPC